MATGQVYRSVKLVLQNSLDENLAVQGFAVLTGAWAEKLAPTQGMVVGEQSAAELMSVSTTLGSGTAAYVRLSSSYGYLMIRWNLPWTGSFEQEVTDHEGLTLTVKKDDSHPDAVVLMVTVTVARRVGA